MEATPSSFIVNTQAFNNVAVGIGALFAGLASLKVLSDWIETAKEKRRRDRLRAELRVKYPSNKHGDTYRLIESDSPRDWVYLHDKVANKRHHIASMLTLLRLGYRRDITKRISQEEFDSIPDGDEFLTDGERYS